MTTYSTGQAAEKAVAEFLRKQHFYILAHNWRTSVCEIDLVVRKKKTIYFVEVKYRKTPTQGTGFDYITPRKLQRMRFAGEMWIAQHDWQDNWSLAAAEVSGPDLHVTFIDSVT